MGLTLSYFALQWSFIDTFLPQYLFSSMYLMSTMQLGRVLGIFFRGDYHRLTKMYSLYIFFTFLFGVISPNKIPPYLSWLVYMSSTFWAVSGSGLTQFQFNHHIGERPVCQSLASCLAYEPNVLGRFFGYTPISTSHLSMIVLVLSLTVLMIIEGYFLYSRYGIYKKKR